MRELFLLRCCSSAARLVQQAEHANCFSGRLPLRRSSTAAGGQSSRKMCYSKMTELFVCLWQQEVGVVGLESMTVCEEAVALTSVVAPLPSDMNRAARVNETLRQRS